MGCIQQSQPPMINFDDDSNEATVSKDNDDYDHQTIYDEYKEILRDIKQQSEENMISLNQITLRVTNEISMLLHRNFDSNPSDFLQRKRLLGSWWYSAIKNHKNSGIAMWNNKKIKIIYDDELEPKQQIQHTIELIAGLFWTKIDFKDESVQITFEENDFLKKPISTNSYFENAEYDENGSQHMIDYTKCATIKSFEYLDAMDIKEKKDRMPNELRIDVKEQQTSFIYVSDICTDSEYRRKGIATCLWQKLFKLYDKGTQFGAHVRFDNKAAHNLFFKMGFQHIGIVTDYYAKNVHAWKMVLVL